MNHYDDLQRFKEKTRTHSLKFKDLSSEAAASEKGDWVILNQLIPVAEESSIAMGGSVSLPLPQLVPVDMFRRVESEPVQAAPPSPPVAVIDTPAPVAVAPVVPEKAATSVPEAMVPQSVPVNVPAPAIKPRQAIAPTAEGYAHLFATKTVEPELVAKDKDQPLKSLLERIATCR
ncbi:cellulose biosynthesis protein BcsO [Klebsiella sp. RHBSTW-00484]|uniref:cellulose biosynthesis protein BcsO n=1 Tax=unclassified Klebsiella TaxID=2608929 RepID=UPI0015E5088D|nr:MULTISPECIES: cellulose biosynthesis protein BcsO [unclassified Klebsiella]MBA7844649.1 cellulose biosynthesis protein BcsO [Klebsiella sp. RHBSTW-00465]QLO34575.1 cellulose biosynthesis protein BcsO [Klebsiella sp. RHBSTW-00484]QLT74089.1 cellulose biosynthesis protein BcsO [Klebsiella sp. RHBSTW-00464]